MTTFSEFKQMVDNYTEYAGDAKRIIDAADKYYGEQLSSLQADNEKLMGEKIAAIDLIKLDDEITVGLLERLKFLLSKHEVLKADNERLREALQKIDAKSYGNTHWEDMQGINDLAKAALQNK